VVAAQEFWTFRNSLVHPKIYLQKNHQGLIYQGADDCVMSDQRLAQPETHQSFMSAQPCRTVLIAEPRMTATRTLSLHQGGLNSWHLLEQSGTSV
jgi:hypothetical protein